LRGSSSEDNPHGHAHEGDDSLVWQRENIDHAGFTISLGHHGVRLLRGEQVEPAISITRGGVPVANAKVFNSLLNADTKSPISDEVATVYEPTTENEPAHYAQGGLKLPSDADRVIIRYRLVLPNDGGEWVQDVAVPLSLPGLNDDGGHEGHVEADALRLSKQALKNVGYKEIRIELQTFVRTVTIPAMVVERPGRSQFDVTAPMTGIVTKVYCIEGEAIEPGQPLFDLHLTHEDLVTAQRDFLRMAEELDVVEREVKRLQSVGDVIPGKRILERQYEEQKIKAALHAQRQGLLLHGLTEEQLDQIQSERSLQKKLTIFAPEYISSEEPHNSRTLFHLQRLHSQSGKQVSAGTRLAVLADHRQLYVEGRAFEEDAERLNQAAKDNWNISAVLMSAGKTRGIAENLQILYLSDQVEPESRAFKFYIALPNEVVRNQMKDGHRFIGWRYKPGQRMEVRIPVQQLEQRFVLPVEAVVEDGAETFVFQMNGDHFDRVAVHVELRDRDFVVIANDGVLYPGDIVAASGAYQMNLALKNKAGGGVDPHAGHNH
jgi:multidrug efflux pump subunit AcrA (membrane-fusion protein)